jgi:hypothetical protein
MVTPFSLGRTDETVELRVLTRFAMPGGSLLLPGERISVTPSMAQLLIEQLFAEAATPPKSLDAPTQDRMQPRPMMKKGMEHGK